jgi:DNA polymerase V
MKISETLTFYALKASTGNGAILVDAGISAGFPSVAEDICETRISLDDELIRNKDTTFFARVKGQSMIDAGLDDNDLLVIDRSLEPANNKIAVCFLDGEFTVKRLRVEKNEVWLQPENLNYPIINITAENDFVIWGIVTNVIKKV